VTAVVGPPRHIEVNGERIHLRWAQQFAWSALGAAVGAYMVSAVYYLVTQVKWPGTAGHTILYLKPQWDGLFHTSWWRAARHDYRDCYEGVFATLFIRSIVTSPKYWGKRVGWLRLATSPLLVGAAAFPVITLGIWLIDIHNWHAGLPAVLVTYQAILIGFVAGQIVHRLYAPIGNTVQLLFIEQALAAGRRPRWPLPPVVRERYAWMEQEGVRPREAGAWFTAIVWFMSAALVSLAIYGAYVRLIVAHR
jgi:hypothetical protein